MPELRILSDENIPLVLDWFGGLGEVKLLPGHRITPEALTQTDVLLVRSVTRIDERLLHSSPVRFVGSATIGTDHVDLDYLKKREIAFAHAPGSNADSVVEYVLAALTALASRRGEVLRGSKAAIVGCGTIGGRLSRRLAELGCDILMNDPPLAALAEAGGERHEFRPLEEVLKEADIVSIHVPLIKEGPFQTTHLLDSAHLKMMKEGAWLLNTSRGEVVDGAALVETVDRPGAIVLDVWEREPSPDPYLVERVDLATPHIAGYSYDGKVAGTRMLLEALCAYLGVESARVPDAADAAVSLAAPDPRLPQSDWLHEVVRQMYSISEDDARMRARGDRTWAEHFTALRRDYPTRRTFSLHSMESLHVPRQYRRAASGALDIRLTTS